MAKVTVTIEDITEGPYGMVKVVCVPNAEKLGMMIKNDPANFRPSHAMALRMIEAALKASAAGQAAVAKAKLGSGLILPGRN